MCGNCSVEIPVTHDNYGFYFLLHFGKMFSLAEKVMDFSMKGLYLNSLHTLVCHYEITSSHHALLCVNLLFPKIISSISLCQ
jgi:hypothetical protein